MKIATIIGARPQFIKAASVSKALREKHTEIIVHTGQHYDANMSDIFFKELDIPKPDYTLNAGSGSHGTQTGLMLSRIEKALLSEHPDRVLLYGDTNSTIAGALAAAKMIIPVCHIEAGLRSFNKRMPEEINRIVTDHISDLLLCPSGTAVDNLKNEGITNQVYIVGDVMADALKYAVETSGTHPDILKKLEMAGQKYFLATVHRQENTDDPVRLQNILRALSQTELPVIFPVHPRTRKHIGELIQDDHVLQGKNIRFIDPAGYLDMVRLEQSAKIILTDSGGIQKEAYWLGVPCITLRDETEWVETVSTGWNILAGADYERIVESMRSFVPPENRPPLYGDGHAAARCAALINSSTGT